MKCELRLCIKLKFLKMHNQIDGLDWSATDVNQWQCEIQTTVFEVISPKSLQQVNLGYPYVFGDLKSLFAWSQHTEGCPHPQGMGFLPSFFARSESYPISNIRGDLELTPQMTWGSLLIQYNLFYKNAHFRNYGEHLYEIMWMACPKTQSTSALVLRACLRKTHWNLWWNEPSQMITKEGVKDRWR